MCFSATASFTASAGLAALGVISLRQKKTPGDLLLLSFPLLFASQQLVEGFLWLELEAGRAGLWANILTQTFLLYAQVLWPILVPIAAYLVETDERRKKVMRPLMYYGFILGGLLLIKLIVVPYHAVITVHSIRYQSAYETVPALTVFYGIGVVAPLLISSRSLLVVFGGLVVLAFMFATQFFAHAYVSVWCFYTAVLSGAIIFYAFRVNRAEQMSPA